MRDRPFSPSAHDFATPGFTRAPSQPRETSRRQRNEKPRLFNKRIIFRVAGKCCRNVTAVRYDRRARRAERAGRSFIGIGVRMRLRRSETFHRTRERVPGLFSSSRQPTCLYIDPHLPNQPIRVSPLAYLQPPPSQTSRSAKKPPKF